jgi:Uma2 family endonuclease
MTQSGRLHRYTYVDYVALEESSPTKHEFFQGEIYAMAGGSEEHSALAAEVLRILGNALADRPCRAHTSDLRIYVEATGMATFPDASVICGKLQQHAASPRTTALNPMLLVEVTSDSSEEYDTTTKLQSYQTIASLQDYLVVSHRERRITLHFRGSDGSWQTRVAIAGGKLSLSSVPAELQVDELYRASTIP